MNVPQKSDTFCWEALFLWKDLNDRLQVQFVQKAEMFWGIFSNEFTKAYDLSRGKYEYLKLLYFEEKLLWPFNVHFQNICSTSDLGLTNLVE